MQLYSLTGKLLRSQAMYDSPFIVKQQELPAGVYLMEMQQDGLVWKKRLVIEWTLSCVSHDSLEKDWMSQKIKLAKISYYSSLKTWRRLVWPSCINFTRCNSNCLFGDHFHYDFGLEVGWVSNCLSHWTPKFPLLNLLGRWKLQISGSTCPN